jgi:predicted anti-sigma-YlaC factor YlaD
METLVARCPANMPEATLSAWYDRELSSELDARVRDHIAQCRACQMYLDDFEATRRTLR